MLVLGGSGRQSQGPEPERYADWSLSKLVWYVSSQLGKSPKVVPREEEISCAACISPAELVNHGKHCFVMQNGASFSPCSRGVHVSPCQAEPSMQYSHVCVLIACSSCRDRWNPRLSRLLVASILVYQFAQWSVALGSLRREGWACCPLGLPVR
jgi:hypothetical protein